MNNTNESIETLRQKMIESGKKNGYTHPETIKLSQELDELLNQQMNIGGK